MPTGSSRSLRAGRVHALVLPAVVAIAFGAGCNSTAATPTAPLATPSPSVNDAARLRYVALGDSYTIGTSVGETERFPSQLVATLPQLDLVANLGVNGFTSRDLIEVELPRLPGLRPDVVTVLIGVNDVVQGVPAEVYRANVVRILDALIEHVGAGRIVAVTIPDYTVTPAGADYGDPAKQSAGIQRNNAIMTELATARGIVVVDIFDISLEGAADRGLVAGDGLHPSGAQYGRWVERIAPAMGALLGA